MSDFNEQLARMKGLMNYGKVNENSKQQKNYTLEHHMEAADGKTYGIVRECNRYYIKQAEAGKELMAENYKYLGGFNNKKDYEYYSYTNALKQFELKMASINEACEGNVKVSTLDPFRKNAILAEGTNKMRDEIARQRQIMYNAAMLMNESNSIGATPITSQPESEHANSGDEDAPFTQSAKVDMTFDGKNSSCPKCEGDPFDKGEKCSCKAEKGKNVTEPNSVNRSVSGGYKQPKFSKLDEADEKMFNAGLPATPGMGDPQSVKFMDGAEVVNEEDEFEEEVEDVEAPEAEGGEFDAMSDDEDFGDEGSEFEDDEEVDDEEMGDEDFEDEDEMDDEDFEDEEMDDEDFEDEEEVDESDPESVRAEIERLQSVLDDLEGGEEMDMDGEDDFEDDEDFEDGEEDFEGDEEMDGEDFEDEDFDGEDFEDDEEMDDEEEPEALNEGYKGMTLLFKVITDPRFRERYTPEEECELIGRYAGDQNSPELKEYLSHLNSDNDGITDTQSLDSANGSFVNEFDENDPEAIQDAYGERGFTIPSDAKTNTLRDYELEDENEMHESKRRYMNSIVESVVKDIKKSVNEETLNVFGKHPGYRKKPMQLPATGEDKNAHGRDWNDSSVYSEEPFGQSKGDSTPFDDVVEKITAKVMEGLKKK